MLKNINHKNIIKLLEEFKSDAYFASIIKELKEMQAEFEGAVLDEKKLIELNKKAAKLRNRIIEGL